MFLALLLALAKGMLITAVQTGEPWGIDARPVSSLALARKPRAG